MKHLIINLVIVFGFVLISSVNSNADNKVEKIPLSFCEGRLYYGEHCFDYSYKKPVFVGAN